MASDRQIQANRQNAQLSTGPSSPEGKQRVASNALKHGLTGKEIVLPNEKPEDFDAFRSDWWEDLDPRGILEEVLADKIVADAWRLRRVPIFEAAMHARDKGDGDLERLRQMVNRLQLLADKDTRALVEKATRVDPRDQAGFDRLQSHIRDAENEATTRPSSRRGWPKSTHVSSTTSRAARKR
jgi:hypothetical protein